MFDSMRSFIFLPCHFRRNLIGLASWTLSVGFCSLVATSEPILLENLPDNSSSTKLSLQEIARAHTGRKNFDDEKLRFFDLELENLCHLIYKSEVARYLEQNVDALHASQRISHLQRATFQWFHEANLPMDAITLSPPVRSQLLVDLRHYSELTIFIQEQIQAERAKYQELLSTVEQRLKWACGANPDLQSVFDAFSSSFTRQMESLRILTSISKTACSTANAVLHFEALRTQSAESVNSDSAFIALVGECQNAASLQKSQVRYLYQKISTSHHFHQVHVITTLHNQMPFFTAAKSDLD